MATITIDYDARNTTINKFIDALLSIKGVTVKSESKQPKYSNEFRAMIKQGEADIKAGRTKKINVADLWK